MKKILSHLSKEWYKYLLEMIVITAGILGAYALNSWNEDRKDQKVEVKFYREMVADLKVNLKEIKGTDQMLKQNLEDIDSIDHYLKTNKPVNDSLKTYFARFQGLGIINIANSAYQFMQNNGLTFVKDDTLRIWITAMYEHHLFNIKYRNERHSERLYDKIEPFMSKYFRYSDIGQVSPTRIRMI